MLSSHFKNDNLVKTFFLEGEDESIFIKHLRLEMDSTSQTGLGSNLGRRLLLSFFSCLFLTDEDDLLSALRVLDVTENMATSISLSLVTCKILDMPSIYSNARDDLGLSEPKLISRFISQDSDCTESDYIRDNFSNNNAEENAEVDSGDIEKKNEMSSTLLLMLYYRLKLNARNSCGKSALLRLINEQKAISDTIWKELFYIAFIEEDIVFLSQLYDLNEFLMSYMADEFVELSIKLNLLSSLRFLYSKGIVIKVSQNIFEMIESETSAHEGYFKLINNPFGEILSYVRDREDINVILKLRDVDHIELLSHTKDPNLIELILSI